MNNPLPPPLFPSEIAGAEFFQRVRDTAFKGTQVYEESFQCVCNKALDFLEAWEDARVDRSKLSAVILDIDGTVLDDRKSTRIGDQKLMSAHLPMRHVYNKILEDGHVVFFVSSRYRKWETATKQTLGLHGFSTYERLCLFPDEWPRNAYLIWAWKDEMREAIAKEYHILACIGDQQCDVAGSNIGERQFKLPEPPAYDC